MTKTRNYVNNKDLLQALIDYNAAYDAAEAAGETLPQIPEYIGEAIYLISTRMATRPNFSGYSYKEDMIMDGIENCVQYIRSFKPEKSTNPFGYFTQVIWYAFIRRIQKEKKQQYIIMKTGQSLLHSGGTYDGDEQLNLTVSSDFVNAFIEDYEETNLPKKKPTVATTIDKPDAK